MIGTLMVAAALCGQGQEQEPTAYLAAAGSVLVAGWAEHFKATAPVVIDGRTTSGDDMARASEQSDRERLIARRRARKTTRYVGRLRQEAAEAQAIQAQAKAAQKQYEKMLPYMLEARRQNLQYQAAHEAAMATRDIANSIRRSAGYAQGVQQPVRVVNDPSVYAP